MNLGAHISKDLCCLKQQGNVPPKQSLHVQKPLVSRKKKNQFIENVLFEKALTTLSRK